MARRDNSPVGNTCPYINRVISFIESVDVTDDNRSEIKNALEELEVIRSMNQELRDWGNEQYDLVCELEAEIEEKTRDINYMTDKVSICESNIDILTSKIHELNVNSLSNPTPKRFYVVDKKGDWEQLSIGIDNYDDAVKFRDSDFNLKYHPNAFIVASFK